ncbi:T6SS phospholipase effector Tle1-like catalytic domain-containing protein [Neisseria dumasiana]|uniref:T6SS phospholipase effector Tle1-like catalytic domain-containing protein n=1 Tax=Neisseria dumasiana TaxID=1931275 RepID=UPI000A19A6C3|nr:DUF2235 domain-containing protein [Neisseria dumasiana]UOO84590.1 DUF2235 domain-containing protein [Neisseria dumasiana]
MATIKFADRCRTKPFELDRKELTEIAKLRSTLQPANCDSKGRPNVHCSYDLHIGVFFDGTNNNKYFDTQSKSHSNVARLYDVFPGQGATTGTRATRYVNEYNEYETRVTSQDYPKRYHEKMPANIHKYFRKIYVPGVGTPFPDVGDANTRKIFPFIGQNTAGEAFGAYGAERIFWAMAQVLSLAMETCGEGSLPASVIQKIAKGCGGQVFRGESSIRNIFQLHLDPYLPRMQNTRKPNIRNIKLYIFGFSRGAAAARSFASRINYMLQGLKIGFRLELSFLGIFDTVASVGLARSGGGDGHYDWALPKFMSPSVRKCVHLVSAHEIRGSFPLTSAKGITNTEEIAYPGVHSDVGGGYSPFEQGKSTEANGDIGKLSQIPLADMYRKALLSGVPFLLPSEWKSNQSVNEVMAVSKQLIISFNHYYTATYNKNWNTQNNIKHIINYHYSYYVLWHKARYGELAAKLGDKINNENNKTAIRDYNDIVDAEKGLKYELKFLQEYKETRIRSPYSLSNTVIRIPKRPALKNEMTSTRTEYAMREKYQQWEKVLKNLWNGAPLSDSKTIAFFDDYVHDSRAWFRIESPEAWGYLRLRHVY